MSGKVKSLHGVYKALGRDAFLAAARIYSDHVQKTVEATLSEMESRWFDTGHTITQADKMVRDFQNGYLTRESAEELLVQEKLQRQFAENMNAVLKNVHFVRLESSCASPNKSYAGEVLKQMHNAFMKTYGTDYLDGSIVMKTGVHPFVSQLKLFFKWGISFPEEAYTVTDQGARRVCYTSREKLIRAIAKRYPQEKKPQPRVETAAGGQSMTEPAEATTVQEINHAAQRAKATKPVRTG